MANALSDKERALMDAYWRAANYLSVGQIYLYDNPLLKVPKDGSWIDIGEITIKTALGLGALAMAAQGWALHRTTLLERALLTLAGLLLVFPSLIEGILEALIGRDISYTATFGLVIAAAVLLKQRMQPAPPAAPAGG